MYLDSERLGRPVAVRSFLVADWMMVPMGAPQEMEFPTASRGVIQTIAIGQAAYGSVTNVAQIQSDYCPAGVTSSSADVPPQGQTLAWVSWCSMASVSIAEPVRSTLPVLVRAGTVSSLHHGTGQTESRLRRQRPTPQQFRLSDQRQVQPVMLGYL